MFQTTNQFRSVEILWDSMGSTVDISRLDRTGVLNLPQKEMFFLPQNWLCLALDYEAPKLRCLSCEWISLVVSLSRFRPSKCGIDNYFVRCNWKSSCLQDLATNANSGWAPFPVHKINRCMDAKIPTSRDCYASDRFHRMVSPCHKK